MMVCVEIIAKWIVDIVDHIIISHVYVKYIIYRCVLYLYGYN